jgi:hypothetical protein
MSTTDDQFQLEDDPQGSAPDPDEGLTAEQIAERDRNAELERGRAAISTLDKFKPFVEALEKDPSKVFDFRAAVEGKKPAEAAPVITRQEAPQLTEEQLEKINAQIQAEWVNNPAAVIKWVQDNANNAAYQRVMTEAQPIIEAVGGTFIESFKRLKKDNDRFYATVLARFEEEVADLGPGVLLNMPAAQRQRELERRWNAAKGEVLDKKIKPQQTLATSAGGGSGMGGGSNARGGRQKLVEMSENEKAILIRNLGPEKAKARINAIEMGEA